MTAERIVYLVNAGAYLEVRSRLKRLSLKDRLPTLWETTPYVNSTPECLHFFRENFALELGALMMAKGDFEKAEKLYNQAKER